MSLVCTVDFFPFLPVPFVAVVANLSPSLLLTLHYPRDQNTKAIAPFRAIVTLCPNDSRLFPANRIESGETKRENHLEFVCVAQQRCLHFVQRLLSQQRR